MKTIKYRAVVPIFLCVVVIVMLIEPIAQDSAYHQFIDQRVIFNIPHFWNVVSNIPFLLVGLSGLYSLLRSQDITFLTDFKMSYIVFFSGVFLTGLGSAYYHLSPENNTLLWDRLAMALVFMALSSILVGEFISTRVGRLMLWPLIAIGLFSVYYWYYTESQGVGDLRLYILVQFLPVILIPLCMYLFKSKFTHSYGYWHLFLAYILAKSFEYFDALVYESFILLSGHSIKHVVAAMGIYLLLNSYQKRKLIRKA